MPQARGTSTHRPCRATGCNRLVRGYGWLCDKHYFHQRRWGDPEQRPITRGELKSYQKAAARYLDDHGQAGAWQSMRKQWRQIVDQARADLAAQEQQGWAFRHIRTACTE